VAIYWSETLTLDNKTSTYISQKYHCFIIAVYQYDSVDPSSVQISCPEISSSLSSNQLAYAIVLLAASAPLFRVLLATHDSE
jgi:hypothetical protein